MTPDEFRLALDLIGWTGRELGRRLGHKSPSYVSQMARGLRPVPDGLGAWLDGLAVLVDGNPPPKADAASN